VKISTAVEKSQLRAWVKLPLKLYIGISEKSYFSFSIVFYRTV